MAEDKPAAGFWHSVPGVITAIAGLITAVAALVGALAAAKVIGPSSTPVATSLPVPRDITPALPNAPNVSNTADAPNKVQKRSKAD
jgi:hypothetical protein